LQIMSSWLMWNVLQESLAEYIIFWDDDIKPSQSCLAAYAEAIVNNPQVMFFLTAALLMHLACFGWW